MKRLKNYKNYKHSHYYIYDEIAHFFQLKNVDVHTNVYFILNREYILNNNI